MSGIFETQNIIKKDNFIHTERNPIEIAENNSPSHSEKSKDSFDIINKNTTEYDLGS